MENNGNVYAAESTKDMPLLAATIKEQLYGDDVL